jgi:hypothetical protein
MLLIAIPFFMVIYWSFIGADIMKNVFLVRTSEELIDLSSVNWGLISKAIGICAHVLGELPLFLSFIILKLILTNYKNAKIFSVENARYYQYLGYLFLLNSFIVAPISKGIMVFAATFNTLHHYASIGFSYSNLINLFYGSVILIISKVMLEASKIQEEKELTI